MQPEAVGCCLEPVGGWKVARVKSLGDTANRLSCNDGPASQPFSDSMRVEAHSTVNPVGWDSTSAGHVIEFGRGAPYKWSEFLHR